MLEISAEAALKKWDQKSVLINGLLVPFHRAVHSLVRFCRPMAFYNANNVFEISVSGSCFLVRLFDKHVQLTTRHQFGVGQTARDPGESCVIIDKEGKNLALTCSQCGRPSVKGESESDFRDAEDVVLLKFDPEKYSIDITRLFLDLASMQTLAEVSPDLIDLGFSLGFPTELTELVGELNDPEKMSFEGYISRFSRIYLDPSYNPSPMPGHFEFCLHTKQKSMGLVDFDGISGSPVFFLHHDYASQYYLGFAGMIRRAGNNLFHVLDGRYIKRMLEQL